MTVSSYDCSSLEPVVAYNPAYFPCWGLKELPSTLYFTAGPSTPIPPNTSCGSGWPTTEITGSLSRVDGCSYAWSYSSGSFTILFSWTEGGAPVSCDIDQAEMYPSWAIDNATGSPASSGSCSQDPGTGVTTLEFTAEISDGICTCPVTITASP